MPRAGLHCPPAGLPGASRDSDAVCLEGRCVWADTAWHADTTATPTTLTVMGEHTFVLQTIGADDGSEQDALKAMEDIAEEHGFQVEHSTEFHSTIQRRVF